ncbi:MAG: hypothetical protein GYB28_01470 [Gammaproteobacteria bacterium]|nr:hypothetical protein [Gammaproteobacteria bacterium]
MKIKTIPTGQYHPLEIHGEVVNGFDLSEFPEGAKFVGNIDTSNAGVYHVERIKGELHIAVGQCDLAYECEPTNGSHDWAGTGEWIDAADYDPDRCYIVATSAPDDAEYVKRDNGWTVVVSQQEELTP